MSISESVTSIYDRNKKFGLHLKMSKRSMFKEFLVIPNNKIFMFVVFLMDYKIKLET